MQRLGAMQSLSFWQGNTHLPNCVLQWAVAHWASLVQGSASGPGVESVPPAAGAAPGTAAGAGVVAGVVATGVVATGAG
jgi:hypothetical protein